MMAIAGCHSERSEESLRFCILPSIGTEPFLLRHSMNGGLKRSSFSATISVSTSLQKHVIARQIIHLLKQSPLKKSAKEIALSCQ